MMKQEEQAHNEFLQRNTAMVWNDPITDPPTIDITEPYDDIIVEIRGGSYSVSIYTKCNDLKCFKTQLGNFQPMEIVRWAYFNESKL